MRSSTRFLDSAVMRGPTSQPGSCPADTFSSLALLIKASLYLPIPPTNTAAEMAMQRCPAAPKAAPTRAEAVASGLASGMMTAWFLAPLFACCNQTNITKSACAKCKQINACALSSVQSQTCHCQFTVLLKSVPCAKESVHVRLGNNATQRCDCQLQLD